MGSIDDSKLVAHLLRSNAELSSTVSRLTKLLEKYEKHPPSSDSTRSGAMSPAEKQAAYRARKATNSVTSTVTNLVTNQVTNPVTHSRAVVSSYKADISRESLSPLKGEREILTTQRATALVTNLGNSVGNAFAVTEPPLRDAINPESQDRDWRKMIRTGAS